MVPDNFEKLIMVYLLRALICLAFLIVPTGVVRRILLAAKVNLKRLEMGFISLFLGQIFFVSFVFVLSLLIGLSEIAVLVVLAVFACVDIFLYARKRQKLKVNFNMEPGEKVILFVLLLSSLVFLFLLQRHMLPETANGLFTPHNTYGDIQYHLAIINSFFLGKNFPPQNPIYAGVNLAYPFMIDFYTAIFRTIGFNLQYSLIIPGLIFGECVFASLLLFAYRFCKSITATVIAFLIFIFNGGLGGYLMLKESWGTPVSGELFTQSFRSVIEKYNFRFPNAVSSVFMAERPILVGMAAFLIVLLLLYVSFEKTKGGKEMVLAGLIIGLLPLWHTHALIALGIVLPFYVLSYWIYNKATFVKAVKFILPILYFSIPLGILGMLWHLPQVFGGGLHFFSIKLGWVVGSEGLFNFWLTNLGVFIPLLLVGYTLLDKKQKLFYLPIFVIFILGNIINFQPFNWDNYKIFLAWYAVSSIVVSVLVTKLFELNLPGKSLAVAVTSFFVISGALLIIGDYQTFYGLFSKEDIVLAKWEIDNTDPGDLVLTGPQHNQFSILAGRQILMGYPGYLWTQGIDNRGREIDIKKMYKGDVSLIKKYGVDYIVLGYIERESYNPDETFLNSTFPLVKQTQNFKIYKVTW